jgi:hypothetical protein
MRTIIIIITIILILSILGGSGYFYYTKILPLIEKKLIPEEPTQEPIPEIPGGQTPSGGQQTGGQTPGGGQTGGQTPSGGQTGGQTPSGGQQTGGQTPGGGQQTGGQTPSGGQQTGGQTPSGGQQTGGQTPSGGQTGGQTQTGGGATQQPSSNAISQIISQLSSGPTVSPRGESANNLTRNYYETPSPITNTKLPCNGRGTPDPGLNNMCDCKDQYFGINCEFRGDMCLNNILPSIQQDSYGNKSAYCNCKNVNTNYEEPHCCDKRNQTYTNFETSKEQCTNKLSCSSTNAPTNGWEKEPKKCSEIDLNSNNCKKYTPYPNLTNLRCNTIKNNKGVVSASYKKYNNIFMEALRHPPNEKHEDNNKYWLVMKTDRDLSNLLSDIMDNDAKNVQANYGAFFIAHKFPYKQDLVSEDNTTITNEDLNIAINNVFTGQNCFAMDNYGNMSIKILSSGSTRVTASPLIIKNFQNPLFPSSDEENNIDFKTLCQKTKEYQWNDTANNCKKINSSSTIDLSTLCRQIDKVDKYDNFIGKTFWNDSTGKCYNYFIDTDLNSSPLDHEGFKSQMNRNFITTKNRKWILYRDIDPINPTITGKPNIQHYLLYNPIHSKYFGNYYRSLPTGKDRMNEFIIKKYGELNAEKGTYNLKLRRYGDPTSRCTNGYSNSWFTLPDCAALSVSDYYYFTENNFNQNSNDTSKRQYESVNGSCVCSSDKCDMKTYKDSYVNEFYEDIKKYIFKQSKENDGKCPNNLMITFCNVNINSNGSVNFGNQNTLSNDCGNMGIPNLPTPFPPNLMTPQP